MLRNPPNQCPNTDEVFADSPLPLIWHTLKCELMTPMYGGGVESTVVDKHMPIRTSSIRGNLRFWWRLLAKHKWKLNDIATKEKEIWGGVGNSDDDGKAGKVLLKVTDIKNITIEQWATYEPNKNDKLVLLPKEWANAPYALFSAQGKLKNRHTEIDERPHELLKAGTTWKLQVAFSPNTTKEQIDRVWEAIGWWASFGGVGARTRRGLGAIHIQENEYFKIISINDVQALGFDMKLKSANNPNVAWVNAVDKLQSFRQIGAGRNNHNSRSHWSEPDAIRQITGQSLPEHSERKTNGDIFPRAGFGLPIITKFKDNNEKGDDTSRNRDPRTTILTLKAKINDDWQEFERLTSPLIIRPYIDEKGKWHSLALVLDELLYDQKNFKLYLDDTEVAFWDSDKAQDIKPLKQNGNAVEKPLQAFLNYFAK